jgi:hypothetical protein
MPKKLTLENHLNKKQLRWKSVSCQHSQEKKRRQALSLMADGEIANTVAKQADYHWLPSPYLIYSHNSV